MLEPVEAEGWTDARVELLKDLWREGRSCAQIANVLGGGATRNSVIGKIHRLKLGKRIGTQTPRRPAAPRPYKRPVGLTRRDRMTQKKVAAASAPQVKLVAEPIKEIVETGANLISILLLTDRTCKWPIGDPLKPDFGFCGCAPVEGKPYCERHRARATRVAA